MHKFNRIRRVVPMCTSSIVCARCRQFARRHPAVSCAEMAEPIDLPFGLWTGMKQAQVQSYSAGGASVPSRESILAPPGEYD